MMPVLVAWRGKPRRGLAGPQLSALTVLILAALEVGVPIPLGTEACGAEQRSKPNIVFVLADDLGYGDVACYGCPDTRTPNIDRLAKQGARFTAFYANGPECTPTRTGLMTGRYQARIGGLECAIGIGNVGRYDDAIRLAEQHQLGLPAEENQLVQSLKQAGYLVAGVGKWHLGYDPQFMPLKHGFDRYFGPLGGGVDYFYHVEWDGGGGLYENGKMVQREGYLTDLITESAVEFLDRASAEKPFFLYLPYTAPHTPLTRPGAKPAQVRTEANWNEGDRATYVEVVERLDMGVGKVLEAIERRGLTDRTLVVFASDNGGTKIGRNAPFSGQKGGLMEGGIRVPCVVRWPGAITQGKTVDFPAIMMDLTASMVRIAGGRPRPDRPWDGIDVLKHVAEGRTPPTRALCFRQRRGDLTWRSIREGDWKYVCRAKGTNREEHLFNLDRDPAENDDLLETKPQEASRLKARLAAWEREVQPQR